MARHFEVKIKATVTMIAEDGGRHRWPWQTMGFPELTQEQMVEVEQQFKKGFADPMYEKGLAKLEEKKRKNQ